jgi:hypothetical protein
MPDQASRFSLEGRLLWSRAPRGGIWMDTMGKRGRKKTVGFDSIAYRYVSLGAQSVDSGSESTGDRNTVPLAHVDARTVGEQPLQNVRSIVLPADPSQRAHGASSRIARRFFCYRLRFIVGGMGLYNGPLRRLAG